MSTNEAYLTRCPKCGQYLFEEDSKKMLWLWIRNANKRLLRRMGNEDDPWYRDPFDDIY